MKNKLLLIMALFVMAVLFSGCAQFATQNATAPGTTTTPNQTTTTPTNTTTTTTTTPTGTPSGSGGGSTTPSTTTPPAGGGGSTTPSSGGQAVNLGTAGDFAILSKAGISTTGTTLITGDMGVSPIDSTAITGFGLTMDASNTFSTSSLVTGKIYASDYTGPPATTPTKMTTAVSDMETAYTTGNGLAAGVTELGAGNIGGMTLASGVYKWGTDLTIPTDVTLSGGANDVWVFQIAGKLDISSATKVKLSGGAQAKNVFWIVGDTTTLGTTSVFNGNILDQTDIVLNTGATLNGRALAQTAVTLDANAVTKA